jgi:hypothetical protein
MCFATFIFLSLSSGSLPRCHHADLLEAASASRLLNWLITSGKERKRR